MKTIAIIPSRIGSQRLPRKPLRKLGEWPIVVHVYKRCAKWVDRTIVATDSEEICNVVESYGGEAILTSALHRSGTDRCLEAYQKLDQEADIILNIQGDEPFVCAEHIGLLKDSFLDPSVDIATLCIDFCDEYGDFFSNIKNPNMVKVLRDVRQRALYFSRALLPYPREENGQPKSKQRGVYFKHLGMYAYRPAILKQICALDASMYEEQERLEQLRWLQNSYSIVCQQTKNPTIGIDTEEDLEKAWQILQKENIE